MITDDYTVFNVDKEKERLMMREQAKNCKRYRVLTPIFYSYMIIGSLAIIVWLAWCAEMSVIEAIHKLIEDDAVIIYIGAWILFVFIPECIINAIRVSGGRDIFGTRLYQQIIFNTYYFCNSWVPRFSNIEPAKHIEYHIRYEDISRIDYNDKYKRLEIYGKRDVLKDLGHKQEHIEEDVDKPYIVYEYFENMEQLKQKLCRYTGLNIQYV